MRKAEWKEALLSPYRLRELFDYDPVTGELRWRHRQGSDRVAKWANTKFAGKIAGYVEGSGYRLVTLHLGGESTSYLVHRVIWALVEGEWPVHEVDHENGVRWDNRWDNLRAATPSQNCQNKRKPLGAVRYKGVTFEKQSSRYRARITTATGRRSLGLFPTAEEAAAAYDRAALVEHGTFSVTNLSLGLLEG